MISPNALSTFILNHNLNGRCDKNVCSIQERMCTINPARIKFKHVCKYFPNIAILTKNSSPGDVQLTFTHASVGNNYHKEFVAAFSLVGFLEAARVFSIDVNIAFSVAGNKIWVPVTKVIPCASAGNLARSKT